MLFHERNSAFLPALAALLLPLPGGTLQAIVLVIVEHLPLLGWCEFSARIKRRRVLDHLRRIGSANDLASVIHLHPLLRKDVSSTDEPRGFHPHELDLVLRVNPEAGNVADAVAL